MVHPETIQERGSRRQERKEPLAKACFLEASLGSNGRNVIGLPVFDETTISTATESCIPNVPVALAPPSALESLKSLSV
jgi:hypothetical protein